MSLRAFVKLIYNTGLQVALKTGLFKRRMTPLWTKHRWERMLKLGGQVFLKRRIPSQSTSRLTLNLALRPFAALNCAKDKYHRRYAYLHLNGLLNLHKRNSLNTFENIKILFNSCLRYNKSVVEEVPTNLEGYEIGKFIASGCNAAVYETRVKKCINATSADLLSLCQIPLAIKVMFNSDTTLSDRMLWHLMGPELIPMNLETNAVLTGHIKPLKRAHPNVIKLHTAFLDVLPPLEEAFAHCRQFMLRETVFDDFVPEFKTLFIVMNRYRMTLAQYLKIVEPSDRGALVMLGQLLEAVAYLYERVAHRDMKSDNILLDFNDIDEVPHLVLSDFGFALTTPLMVRYVDEFTNLGGNRALRAPEISRCELKKGIILDYSLADLWSAGTLAYEIYTRKNPFYSKLRSTTYVEENLTELPSSAPHSVKKMVRQLLKIDPQQRPLPSVAANVIGLSLFGSSCKITEWLKDVNLYLLFAESLWNQSSHQNIGILFSNYVAQKLDNLIVLYAAETITAHLPSSTFASVAELQLRATFLSRLDKTQMLSAMNYF